MELLEDLSWINQMVRFRNGPKALLLSLVNILFCCEKDPVALCTEIDSVNSMMASVV